MVSQVLIALSLLVVPAASVEHTVHVFEHTETAGCVVLDTTYTGVDLMPGSCKKVEAESVEMGKGTVGFKYTGTHERLKFKVHTTCEDIHGMTVVMEASESESAKILAGECGEVTSYFGDDEGATADFKAEMYMKITSRTDSGAPTTTALPANATAAVGVTDQAESTNMVMPMVLVVLARMLLAY